MLSRDEVYMEQWERELLEARRDEGRCIYCGDPLEGEGSPVMDAQGMPCLVHPECLEKWSSRRI